MRACHTITFPDEPLNYYYDYCEYWLALVLGRSQVWSLKIGGESWDRVPLREIPETLHENYREALLPRG